MCELNIVAWHRSPNQEVKPDKQSLNQSLENETQ